MSMIFLKKMSYLIEQLENAYIKSWIQYNN